MAFHLLYFPRFRHCVKLVTEFCRWEYFICFYHSLSVMYYVHMFLGTVQSLCASIALHIVSFIINTVGKCNVCMHYTGIWSLV